MLSENLDDGGRQRKSGRKLGELLGPFGVHVVFLVAYTALFFGLSALYFASSGVFDSSDTPSSDAELAASLWLLVLVPPIWLLVAALLVLAGRSDAEPAASAPRQLTRRGRAVSRCSDLYWTDDEDVPLVVVPYTDDLQGVFASRDPVTGLPVRRSEPYVG
jgi:hypothetical protein